MHNSIRQDCPVICLDITEVLHLLRSVAVARALQEATTIEWVSYKDSAVLNAIYKVFSWKEGPGTVEVSQPESRVPDLTDRYWEQMIDTFLGKAADDTPPIALAHYLETMVQVRDSSLESVRDLCQEAAEINREIAEHTHRAIKNLAAIRLASTVTLVGLSCGITLVGGSAALAFQAPSVKLGYDVIGAAIKGWNEAEKAKGIAIGELKEAAKKVAETAAEKGAESGVKASEKWALTYLPKIRAAQAKIERYSREVARDLQQRKHKIASRRLAQAATQKGAVLGGTRTALNVVKAARVVKFSVPLVFAAIDLREALAEYHEAAE